MQTKGPNKGRWTSPCWLNTTREPETLRNTYVRAVDSGQAPVKRGLTQEEKRCAVEAYYRSRGKFTGYVQGGRTTFRWHWTSARDVQAAKAGKLSIPSERGLSVDQIHEEMRDEQIGQARAESFAREAARSRRTAIANSAPTSSEVADQILATSAFACQPDHIRARLRTMAHQERHTLSPDALRELLVKERSRLRQP